MMSESVIELSNGAPRDQLAQQVLGGEIVVLRGILQELQLFEPLVEASLAGIRRCMGDETAQRVAREGFDRIHEIVRPEEIPALTDTVYGSVKALASDFLCQFVPHVFPGHGAYYFEKTPNVRFHIPYDLAAPHRRQYDHFAKKHGQGKIAPHGPHRDSWLDCPDNVVNAWIAVGPVQPGNGLSIFPVQHTAALSFKENGEIADGERLDKPVNFDLHPGDTLLFHSDQLHASELNRTDSTRFAVSFRISFGKPHFPNGHYHEYVHAGMMRGMARYVASVPAKCQWSFLTSSWQRLMRKLVGGIKTGGGRPAPSNTNDVSAAHRVDSMETPPLSEIPVGSVRAVSKSICVVRVAQDRVIAVSRRCPHKGADLATGFVEDGTLICPWHNLCFDLETGASACQSIRPLRGYACDVRDGCVHVTSEKATEQPLVADDALAKNE